MNKWMSDKEIDRRAPPSHGALVFDFSAGIVIDLLREQSKEANRLREGVKEILRGYEKSVQSVVDSSSNERAATIECLNCARVALQNIRELLEDEKRVSQ